MPRAGRVEMFEATGRRYRATCFECIRRLLKPGGRACVQAIVIREYLFERYACSADFVQRHVLPGGMLPTTALFEGHAARAGLRIADRHAFGRDYAQTLRRWRSSFLAQLDDVRRLGFDERFIRMWEFCLAYCEAAFDGGDTDVVQVTLVRD